MNSLPITLPVHFQLYFQYQHHQIMITSNIRFVESCRPCPVDSIYKSTRDEDRSNLIVNISIWRVPLSLFWCLVVEQSICNNQRIPFWKFQQFLSTVVSFSYTKSSNNSFPSIINIIPIIASQSHCTTNISSSLLPFQVFIEFFNNFFNSSRIRYSITKINSVLHLSFKHIYPIRFMPL